MSDQDAKLMLFGSPIVAVTVSKLKSPGIPEQSDRFCTHIWHTMLDGKPRTLGGGSLRCIGAKYVLGFTEDDTPPKSLVAELYGEGRAASREDAQHIVSSLRCLEETASIHLERGGKGDVYVTYLNPMSVMYLVQAYQRLTLDPPVFTCPSLAPVCGVAVVQAFLTKKLCISFGCGSSRRYGGIGETNVAVGIPASLLAPLLSTIEEMDM